MSAAVHRYRQKAALSLSHGGNTGSNPVGDANDFFREWKIYALQKCS
jgi:hypothetical protein